MTKRLFSKTTWKSAIGATIKAKRLKLSEDNDGCFSCPVAHCDNEKFRSKRGCRKHVFNKHGWFFYFEEKPDIEKVFPSLNTRESKYQLPKRAITASMPTFLKTCLMAQTFVKWLKSPGGGGKMNKQADQILCKTLKYLKFCCSDVSTSWEIRETVVDYCLGSLTMLSDFVDYLQKEWSLGYSGVIGYMNAIGHMLDYRRSCSDIAKQNFAT